TVQAPSSALQSRWAPSQDPAVQTVSTRQRSSDVQALPSLIGSSPHESVSSLHTTSVHSVPSRPQSFAPPPTQTPSAQTSPTVQKRPSSQAVSFARGMATHWPIGPS